tara:strand:+ start:7645 stop:7923 length:279 start_codon:yes stop_codon:yes gene_type:complete
MTIEELIEELQQLQEQYGSDVQVRLGADYGDYHHTLQALEVQDIIPVQLCESAYSRSGFAVVHNDPKEESEHPMDDPEQDMVILISSVYINQ